MAVVSGTIDHVFNYSAPTGTIRDTTAAQTEVATLFFTANFSGTYDQAANAQILNVPTALQNVLRNGRTITVLSVAFAQPGDEAGVPIGAKTLAVSGSTVTMELTGGDMTTEHAATLLGVFNKSICFFASVQLTNN